MTDKMNHFINSAGRYIGSFTEGTPVEQLPADRAEVDSEPPASIRHPVWTGSDWAEYVPEVEEKRAAEYEFLLGGMGNQVDAIYKLAQILLPALDRADILTPEEKQALTPDKDAPPDTPAGWLGIVGDVKARNPKPAKEAP